MTPGNRAAAALCVAAAGISVPRASAQSASAEKLFREGRTLIKSGKLADGCEKIAASDRLEPSIGALLNLGDCREKLGQLATAWAAFRRAEAMAHRAGNDKKREAEAQRRADKLESQLPSLEIDVPRPVDGLSVRRDDELVDAATFGTPLPIDPGTHTIIATAPGRQSWRKVLWIESRRMQISVPVLERVPVTRPDSAPKVALVGAAVPEPVPPPVVTVTRTEPARSRWTVTRGISAALAVGGVGALATGTYFGLRSRDLREQADLRCPTAACGDPAGLRLNDEAQSDASLANILFAAGGTAALASIVLWFAGSPGETTIITPSIGDRRAGLSVARSF